ncbi:MAG: riboflavin synthase [Saprospiraceae bacterium]
MFCGIVESIGLITKIEHLKTNVKISIQSDLSNDAYIDQSISHNGVCLTVVEVKNGVHAVIAISETLDRTNLKSLKEGDFVNLERSIKADQRIDGHFVQGHTDCTADCIKIENLDGSWKFTFSLDQQYKNLVVMKGSIAVNGTSLTISDITETSFSVSIIPYTFEHTIFKFLKIGSPVNIEFDILGKYIQKNIKTHISSLS